MVRPAAPRGAGRLRPTPSPARRPPPDGPGTGHKVGVLAVQGAFAAHRRVLADLGAEVVEVRTPEQLAQVEALILPGGESTTISMLLGFNELAEPLRRAVVDEGLPTLGTCAGMIVLADHILDGRDDQQGMGAIDIAVRRNAFGRQVDSFEAMLEVPELGEAPFPAVFIRAPVVERAGPDVEVLAAVDGRPVLCRQGAVLVAAFHPELSGDDRLHRRLLGSLGPASSPPSPGEATSSCSAGTPTSSSSPGEATSSSSTGEPPSSPPAGEPRPPAI